MPSGTLDHRIFSPTLKKSFRLPCALLQTIALPGHFYDLTFGILDGKCECKCRCGDVSNAHELPPQFTAIPSSRRESFKFAH